MHRPTKHFLSPPPKIRICVRSGQSVNKAWFQCLTQLRLPRHQPRALAGAIRKEYSLSAEIVRLICRTYPFASLRIKLTQKKAEPRDGE